MCIRDRFNTYDLENAKVKHAAVLIPRELENKSSENPKQKLIIINVTLLVFIGNVSKKTNAIYGLNDPKKLKLLNMKP